MAERDDVHGEGNYEASRQYNQATKRFVESGKVDEAARESTPRTEAEAREMERAEAEGKSRAKEEDPALERGGKTRAANDDAGDKSAAGLNPGFGGTNDNGTEQTRAPMPGKE